MSPTAQADYSNKTALVTGANSGLGFEAAAQLGACGYGRVILACRSVEKAEAARLALRDRVGSDPYETLAVDVSSISSAQQASEELRRRGQPIDTLLLNAGMVSGPAMDRSVDGLELAFATSIVGHHVLTNRLLEAELLSEGARVVIASSEGARGDMAMMDMKLYDFATGAPSDFGRNLHDAMFEFASGGGSLPFHSFRSYATTKLFACWWSASMAEKYGDRISVFAVSPGANTSTNAGRNQTGIKGFIFTKIVPLVGRFIGIDMPVSEGAKRYIDVLHGAPSKYDNGASYMSAPKKLVGPMQKVSFPHLADRDRQQAAWGILKEITGAPAS